MRIIVCVKTVPDVGEIRFHAETGAMIREGVAAVINPYDLTALECALGLAEAAGGSVEAVSMGPASAEAGLRTALAMGAKEAHLLCAREFAGADCLATAHTLAAFLQETGGCDMIVCGKHSADGDTGQVGPELAELLGLPHAGCVSSILEYGNGHLTVEQRFERLRTTVRLPLPCLIIPENDLCFPRMPTLMGTVRARKYALTPWAGGAAAIRRRGLSGSATRVVAIQPVRRTRRGQLFGPEELEAFAREMQNNLE